MGAWRTSNKSILHGSGIRGHSWVLKWFGNFKSRSKWRLRRPGFLPSMGQTHGQRHDRSCAEGACGQTGGRTRVAGEESLPQGAVRTPQTGAGALQRGQDPQGHEPPWLTQTWLLGTACPSPCTRSTTRLCPLCPSVTRNKGVMMSAPPTWCWTSPCVRTLPRPLL